MKKLSVVLIAALLSVFPSEGLLAQEHESEEAGHEAAHEFHANHVAVFLGATTKVGDSEDSETAFTFGVDYERRISRLLGIGLALDWAVSEHERDFLFLVPLVVHPAGGLKLLAAPGLELGTEVAHEGEAGAESEAESTETHSYFAFRFGAEYQFDLGRFSIAPALYLDLIAESRNAWVYGLVLGYGF